MHIFLLLILLYGSYSYGMEESFKDNKESSAKSEQYWLQRSDALKAKTNSTPEEIIACARGLMVAQTRETAIKMKNEGSLSKDNAGKVHNLLDQYEESQK